MHTRVTPKTPGDTQKRVILFPSGDAMPDAPKRGKSRRYKARARRCLMCSESFTPARKTGRFCSPACRNRHWRQKQQGKAAKRARTGKEAPPIASLHHHSCDFCGAGFFTSTARPQAYCSPAHRQAAWRTRQAAAMAALSRLMGHERASAVISLGMKHAAMLLDAGGFSYDSARRAWVRESTSAAAAM